MILNIKIETIIFVLLIKYWVREWNCKKITCKGFIKKKGMVVNESDVKTEQI